MVYETSCQKGGANIAKYRRIDYDSDNVRSDGYEMMVGYSMRCIKDWTDTKTITHTHRINVTLPFLYNENTLWHIQQNLLHL